MSFFRKVSGGFMKAVKNPLTKQVVHAARVGADVASVVGVPGAGAASKGLGAAEEVVNRLQGA